MAKHTINGDDATMMVIEMLDDIDGDDLAKVLSIVIGREVVCVGDDQFEMEE